MPCPTPPQARLSRGGCPGSHLDEFEYLEAWKHHPKPLLPLFGHPHRERVFLDAKTQPSKFQFVSTVFLKIVQCGGLPLLWIISKVSFM